MYEMCDKISQTVMTQMDKLTFLFDIVLCQHVKRKSESKNVC